MLQFKKKKDGKGVKICTIRCFERDHIHITFVIVYGYNCFIISYCQSLSVPSL